jgi:hypothetical protein
MDPRALLQLRAFVPDAFTEGVLGIFSSSLLEYFSEVRQHRLAYQLGVGRELPGSSLQFWESSLMLIDHMSDGMAK